MLETAVMVRFLLVEPEAIPLKATVCGPAFSLIVTPLIGLRVGALNTWLTVTVKVWTTVLFCAWPLSTVTVMVAVP